MNPEPNCSERGKIGTPLDSIVERFEAAWTKGGPADIDRFLPGPGPLRRAALRALVHVDLERRCKNGEAVRIESYLKRYPELLAEPSQVLDLILAEFTHRRVLDPQLGHEEFLSRFPENREELSKRLPTLYEPCSTLAERESPPQQEPGPASPLNFEALFEQDQGAKKHLGRANLAGAEYEILGELGRGARSRFPRPPVGSAADGRVEDDPDPYASAVERTRFMTEARTIARLKRQKVTRTYMDCRPPTPTRPT